MWSRNIKSLPVWPIKHTKRQINTLALKAPPANKAHIDMFDPAESWRWPLAVILLASNVAVWLGVYWEKESFPEKTRDAGWVMLLRGLAAETAAAFLIFAIDTTIQTKSDVKVESLQSANLVLEAQIQPRRLTDEQKAAIVRSLTPFAGSNIVIASYAFDAESVALSMQLRETLIRAGFVGISQIGKHMPLIPPIVTGVRVTGTDAKLVAALKKAFSDDGHLIVSPDLPEPGKEMLVFPGEGLNATATIFVGVKPLPKGAQ